MIRARDRSAVIRSYLTYCERVASVFALSRGCCVERLVFAGGSHRWLPLTRVVVEDDNNATYALNTPVEGARKWYVARDLGQTFGRTGVLDAPRGDVDVFERTRFITGVVNGRVTFDWRGRHDTLLADITPADVRWICSRLQQLRDAQWHDAFRAGGYPPEDAERFIRRLKQKIAEGLALRG